MAKRNISNKNGRALEYIIAQKLIDNYNCKLINNSAPSQIRDKEHYDDIQPSLKKKFDIASDSICNWLSNSYNISNGTIDRLEDDKAVKGDVTDIRINGKINLSIKHNHNALKHQRPPSLAQQCGFNKKSTEDKNYRESHKKITQNFLNIAKKTNPDYTLFKEFKKDDVNFIDDNLYLPVCKNVANFIKSNCSGSIKNTQHLFKFIVGNTDFIKVIVYADEFQIHNYSSVKLPTDLDVEIVNKSYVKIKFNNGWVISMRLHTASSRIAGVSLKFDSQPEVVTIDKKSKKF